MKIQKEDGKLEVRQSWDDATNQLMCLGTYTRIDDLVPNDFRGFFENWDTLGVAANDTVESIEKVGSDNGVDTMKVIAKAPWPISKRIMFPTRYLDFNEEEGHMMLFSSTGNEHIMADPAIYLEKERKKMVLATVFFSGWWMKPIKDESGADVATELLYFSQVDNGGTIPVFIQNSVFPKSTCYAIESLIKWARANKAG